jgi:2-iminobutanoate/2-iminopropanoate deaminase
MQMSNGPLGETIALPDGSLAPLSPGYRTESFIFLSGQLSFDDQGVLLTGGIAEQTEACLNNVDQLLKDAGVSRRHVVKTTVWLTETSDYPAFNKAYAEFFGDHRPARSTVRSDLMLPGARVEIEVIARCGDL